MIFKWMKGKKQPDQQTNQDGGTATPPPEATDKPDGFVENAVALATGLEMVDAYYPGHDPIDFYGDGGFRFGDMSHQGSLMFLPSGIRRWDCDSAKNITRDSLSHVIREADNIEILLIGTGNQLVPLPQDLKQHLRDHSIMADTMDTGAAVRTLNILLAGDRAVAAAILAVD